MCWATSLSRHFITTDVSAMGLRSFPLLPADVFGTGMIIADFQQDGMVARDREILKILVRIPVSWSAQALSTFPGTPSGPAAFLGFTFLSVLLT